MTRVPPAMKRAERSDVSAAAASAGVVKVLITTGMLNHRSSCGLAQMLANGLESRLIDLLADHFGWALLVPAVS